MPPLVLLIPGIMYILENVVGPVVDANKSSIIGKLMSSSIGSIAKDVLPSIESVLGDIESVKKAQLEAQLQAYLSDNNLRAISEVVNGNIDLAETKSENFFIAGWRPSLAWGLTVLILGFGLLNLVSAIVFTCTTGSIQPIPTFLMSLMTILLGGYMTGRTIEKINS